jgi:two-component system KDP operon response regulator KdpE
VRLETAETGDEALRKFGRSTPDLVLLDIRLSGLAGLDVLRTIREDSRVPVIVLTATTEEAMLSEALALGADDVVRKPFSPERLTSLVEHVLFGPAEGRDTERVIRAGHVEIDVGSAQVRVRGEPVTLGRSEWLLLRSLAAHRRQPRLHQELLVEAWGPDYRNDLEYLQLMIARLRAKLGDDAGLIKNYLDVGYSLEA